MILSAAKGKTSPDPAVLRLQTALATLAARVNDPAAATTIDGRIGPLTTAAVNKAMGYVPFAPAELRTGKLTSGQIRHFLPQITSFVEGAALGVSSQAKTPAAAPKPAPQQPGGIPMAAYYPPPQPGYYPPPAYRPPRRGPGGLPTNEASLDVKAFIPAQYEHIQLHPGGVIAGLAVLALAVMYFKERDKKK